MENINNFDVDEYEMGDIFDDINKFDIEEVERLYSLFDLYERSLSAGVAKPLKESVSVYNNLI